LEVSQPLPRGVSAKGIGRDFTTSPPISLYGSTKLAAEALALEWGAAFGAHRPEPDARERPYDVPWVAMDNEEAERDFGWRVETPIAGILEEIGAHAVANPDWLERSGL
jgi:CDP-paratose 2-epimerase